MSQRMTLDSMDMRSRLRTAPSPVVSRPISYQPRARRSRMDFTAQAQQSKAAPQPQPQIAPAQPRVVERRPEPVKPPVPVQTKVEKPKRLRLNQSKLLFGMAAAVFVFGMAVSVMGFYTTQKAKADELAANKVADATSGSDNALKPGQPDGAPSTTPISRNVYGGYQVAPDMARYIKIPKIGVDARVLQVGVTSSGALGTPSNVFDTAWYTGSAKPGQPGATLIDGHVSSWTTNGVFYGIKKLVAGDTIMIQKGDNSTATYKVVKTVVYDVNSVDMKSLMRSADTTKSGLNLITCGGKYDSKSGEFKQRVAVYAVQI